MVSSIPAAIDWLVANIATLTAVGAVGATVHDGYPIAPGETAVAVGIVPNEDGATPSDVVEAQLGAGLEWEAYDIPCQVSAVVVGVSETTTKAARDKAFGIYDAVVTLIRTSAGRTLGGALHSHHALVTGVRVEQTETAAEAGDARVCSIRFAVRCKNRY